MKKKIIMVLTLSLLSAPAYADGGWSEFISNFFYDTGRGIKNMVSAPAEIPIAMKKAYASSSYPVIRDFEGLNNGIWNMARRFGSGFWDVVWANTDKGEQEGLPENPETLF